MFNEDFLNTVSFTVAAVQFDPESDLISKNNSVILAVKNPHLESQFSIYPNPTSNEFSIIKPEHIQVNDVKIFNALGQLIYRSHWSPTINSTVLSSGLLLVQFITNQGIINKTLLKK